MNTWINFLVPGRRYLLYELDDHIMRPMALTPDVKTALIWYWGILLASKLGRHPHWRTHAKLTALTS